MLKTWIVDITLDSISGQYKIEAEDSYDAKLIAIKEFNIEFGTIAHLSDVERCIEK